MLDKATLKLFINKECQILLGHGGGWLEGTLKPIVSEIANLVPSQSDAAAFGLGIAAFHINDIIAIRQINKAPPPRPVVVEKPAMPSKKYTLDETNDAQMGHLQKNGNTNGKE